MAYEVNIRIEYQCGENNLYRTTGFVLFIDGPLTNADIAAEVNERAPFLISEVGSPEPGVNVNDCDISYEIQGITEL